MSETLENVRFISQLCSVNSGAWIPSSGATSVRPATAFRVMVHALETAHDGRRTRAVMRELSVMDTPLPTLRPENAVEAAAKLFGVFADEARSLGCERDQVYWLSRLKVPLAVMKVSNADKMLRSKVYHFATAI